MLYTYEDVPPQAVEWVQVPDVTGLSILEAGRQLRARGLDMVLSGSGLAVSQQPAGGVYTTPGETVIVEFELPQ